MIRWLEIERLAGTRAEVISAPLTLESHRAGSQVTLAGVTVISQGADASLPMNVADRSGMDGAMLVASTSDFDVAAPAVSNPGAVEKIGSASNFASVPEPSTIFLGLMGLVGLVGFARRRRS